MPTHIMKGEPSAHHPPPLAARCRSEMLSDKVALRALLFAATSVSGLTTLYDLPVSNHGARVRLLLYKKGLESAVKIVSPQELGGLRSAEYKALSPQGKMPLLVEDDGTSVWESDAICRHLLDKHADTGPSLRPTTLTARTAAEVICRHHDAYLGPIQGCLYKPVPPFGRFGTRAAALRELV
jgi:glutathione S-transferase